MSVIIDNEIALVGDTMFGVFKGFVFLPYAEDVKKVIHSCGILFETGCTLFIPSHGSAKSRILVQKDYNKRIENYDVQ